MKKMILSLSVLFLQAIAAPTFAVDYNLLLEKVYTAKSGNEVYESPEGVFIKTVDFCTIPKGLAITYTSYGNLYPTSFNQQFIDNVNWVVEEPEIITTVYYDIDGNPISIEEATGETVLNRYECYVTGVMGLENLGVLPDAQGTIYDEDSMTLYLENIKIYKGPYDTGIRYENAVLGDYEENGWAFKVLELGDKI